MKALSSFVEKNQKLCYLLTAIFFFLAILISKEDDHWINFLSAILVAGGILFLAISTLPTVFAAFSNRRNVEQKEEEETPLP